jgi:hypothetical protein
MFTLLLRRKLAPNWAGSFLNRHQQERVPPPSIKSSLVLLWAANLLLFRIENVELFRGLEINRLKPTALAHLPAMFAQGQKAPQSFRRDRNVPGSAMSR